MNWEHVQFMPTLSNFIQHLLNSNNRLLYESTEQSIVLEFILSVRQPVYNGNYTCKHDRFALDLKGQSKTLLWTLTTDKVQWFS